MHRYRSAKALKSYNDLVPGDYVDVDPAKESVELELGDKYDGKSIDKLTLALKKVGASITIDKVVFVKQNDDEEIQSTTASGKVKQVTATPWFEFIKWNQQYLCDETCTLLTYTKSAEESQKYVIEFAEPTEDALQWLPTAVTAGGVEAPAYIGIPVGSEKAELELNSEFEFTKDQAPIEWTSIKSIALQSACADGVTQTVKIKSAKRIITNTTTGISKVENLEVAKDGKSFNLAGQQVGKNYKGVVIKNGKKMVIK